MNQFYHLLFAIFCAWPLYAQRFDDISLLNIVQDTQLEQFIQSSVSSLQEQAVINKYPQLDAYAGYLQQVLRPACSHCIDYYEAVATLRALSKTIKQIVHDNREGIYYPVIRRSYVAAVWLLQRSKMFVWESTHLSSSTVSTMYSLYLHHAQRAHGRTISFHHISKCGGTTMCQLAAANKCSNPHLTIDKNCVMDDRLDSPVWMVSHTVDDTGAFPDIATGVLDVSPDAPIDRQNYNRHEYDTEPLLSMWLMYACPYQLNGRVYGCGGRKASVEATGTTFMANERALSHENGRPQVCPDFQNAVILREPIPHVISLLAEVRFRYERQLAISNITAWKPPAWNLTWWETLGPALVGNYATRSLIGRHSFCRSAGNMGSSDLDQAVSALMSFDAVMTLKRTQDIDLLVSTMFGWTARNFSSQPATRVRDVTPTATTFDLFGINKELLGSTNNSTNSSSGGSTSNRNMHQGFLGMVVDKISVFGLPQATEHGNLRLHLISGSEAGTRQAAAEVHGQPFAIDSGHSNSGSSSDSSTTDDADFWGSGLDGDGAGEDDDDIEGTAAVFSMSLHDSHTSQPVTAEVVEAQKAAALVRTSHLQRQAQQLGFASIAAAGGMLREPKVTHLGNFSTHGAHLVQTVLDDTREIWHVFVRHAFAFTAADMARLEALTKLDGQLVQLADVMLDLDVAWLRYITRNHHFRKRLLAVARTYAACGFAGILPFEVGQQHHTL